MLTLVIVNFVGAGAAASLITYTAYTLLQWPCVDATILRYRKSKGGEGSFFHPVYRFTTLDGRPVVAISSWGSWRRPWQRGSVVAIRYSPSNPQRTEIQCFANQWGFAATIIAMLSAGWVLRLTFG